jgi:hypothetical protein
MRRSVPCSVHHEPSMQSRQESQVCIARLGPSLRVRARSRHCQCQWQCYYLLTNLLRLTYNLNHCGMIPGPRPPRRPRGDLERLPRRLQVPTRSRDLNDDHWHDDHDDHHSQCMPLAVTGRRVHWQCPARPGPGGGHPTRSHHVDSDSGIYASFQKLVVSGRLLTHDLFESAPGPRGRRLARRGRHRSLPRLQPGVRGGVRGRTSLVQRQ